jgi:hypothetical protein
MEADLLNPFETVAKTAVVRVAVDSSISLLPRSYAG